MSEETKTEMAKKEYKLVSAIGTFMTRWETDIVFPPSYFYILTFYVLLQKPLL